MADKPRKRPHPASETVGNPPRTPVGLDEEVRNRMVDWVACADDDLLKEVQVQGTLLGLMRRSTSALQKKATATLPVIPEEDGEEEEDVSLSKLEAEVTEMHQTMTGTSQDPDFLARLASLREDADAAMGDD